MYSEFAKKPESLEVDGFCSSPSKIFGISFEVSGIVSFLLWSISRISEYILQKNFYHFLNGVKHTYITISIVIGRIPPSHVYCKLRTAIFSIHPRIELRWSRNAKYMRSPFQVMFIYLKTKVITIRFSTDVFWKQISLHWICKRSCPDYLQNPIFAVIGRQPDQNKQNTFVK